MKTVSNESNSKIGKLFFLQEINIGIIEGIKLFNNKNIKGDSWIFTIICRYAKRVDKITKKYL